MYYYCSNDACGHCMLNDDFYCFTCRTIDVKAKLQYEEDRQKIIFCKQIVQTTPNFGESKDLPREEKPEAKIIPFFKT